MANGQRRGINPAWALIFTIFSFLGAIGLLELGFTGAFGNKWGALPDFLIPMGFLALIVSGIGALVTIAAFIRAKRTPRRPYSYLKSRKRMEEKEQEPPNQGTGSKGGVDTGE